MFNFRKCILVTFTLRTSTQNIKNKLIASYHRNPKMALLTVKTGGGKTYGAIHTFGQLFGDATLLVFTTAKVYASKQWERSVKDYNQVMGTKLKVICYNYDKLVMQKFINVISRKISLVANKPIILILDEVHRIKMSSAGKLSRRAKTIIALAKQPYIVTTLGLSATAFSNSYLDVSPYLIIAGYYSSKTQFLKEHVKHTNEYFQPIVTDQYGQISRDAFKDPDKIDRELASISVYVNTDSYQPDLTTHHETFTLTSEERSNYNQIMRDFYDGKNSLTPKYEYPIQARMAQEQLLATELASHKDTALIGIIEARRHQYFDGKVTPILIFYQYSSVYYHLLNLISYEYPEIPIVSVNGFANLTKEDLVKPRTQNAVYLIQYEAGGEGLDWQWSNISIFYEAPVRYEKFVQAKGRNVRSRSIMPHVFHYEFEYLDTLDSDRWDTNRNKRDFTKDVSERTFLKKDQAKENE